MQNNILTEKSLTPNEIAYNPKTVLQTWRRNNSLSDINTAKTLEVVYTQECTPNYKKFCGVKRGSFEDLVDSPRDKEVNLNGAREENKVGTPKILLTP